MAGAIMDEDQALLQAQLKSAIAKASHTLGGLAGSAGSLPSPLSATASLLDALRDPPEDRNTGQPCDGCGLACWDTRYQYNPLEFFQRCAGCGKKRQLPESAPSHPKRARIAESDEAGWSPDGGQAGALETPTDSPTSEPNGWVEEKPPRSQPRERAGCSSPLLPGQLRVRAGPSRKSPSARTGKKRVRWVDEAPEMTVSGAARSRSDRLAG